MTLLYQISCTLILHSHISTDNLYVQFFETILTFGEWAQPDALLMSTHVRFLFVSEVHELIQLKLYFLSVSKRGAFK